MLADTAAVDLGVTFDRGVLRGERVGVDSTGNVYAAGLFGGTPDGLYRWATSSGGTGSEWGAAAALDRSGRSGSGSVSRVVMSCSGELSRPVPAVWLEGLTAAEAGEHTAVPLGHAQHRRTNTQCRSD